MWQGTQVCKCRLADIEIVKIMSFKGVQASYYTSEIFTACWDMAWIY